MNNKQLIMSEKQFENFIEVWIGRDVIERIGKEKLWHLFDEFQDDIRQQYEAFIDSKEASNYTFADVQKNIVESDAKIKKFLDNLPLGNAYVKDFYGDQAMRNALYMQYLCMKMIFISGCFLVDRHIRGEGEAKIFARI